MYLFRYLLYIFLESQQSIDFLTLIFPPTSYFLNFYFLYFLFMGNTVFFKQFKAKQVQLTFKAKGKRFKPFLLSINTF